MFDYVTWINWRRSYHEARKVYHEGMSDFYKQQTETVDRTQKAIVDFWSNSISMASMMKAFPTEIPKWGFGLWDKK